MGFTLDFFKMFFLAAEVTAPVLVMLIGGIVILGQIAGRVEKLPPLTALYWSFITATTVGYGDIPPTSRTARILAVIIALFGLILFGVIAAIAVHATQYAVHLHVDPSEIQRLK